MGSLAGTRFARMLTAGIAATMASALDLASVASDSWEKPKTVRARDLLPPELRMGEHHAVADEVRIEGYFYAFTLHSAFGVLRPVGLDLLRTRVEETRALAALREVSKTEVFVEAAGESLASVGQRVLHVVTDPSGTLEGMVPAIDRFRLHLGSEARRLAGKGGHHDPAAVQQQKSTIQTAESVADSALGVNAAARRWARKLHVDPYSRNPLLQRALIAVARIDAAGALAERVAVPIPTAVSAAASVSGLVWDKDPEELHRANEAGLAAVGVSSEVAAEFLANTAFTPTDQTRFVSALAAVRVKGLADRVGVARAARTPREALFFVESAEMLRRRHVESAVSAVLTDSRATVALAEQRAVALLPLDYVAWTRPFAEAAAELAARASQELGANGLEMCVTGLVSARARREVKALGWSLKERCRRDGQR